MYKCLTLINGILLAIMVFFNGMVAKIIGPYRSTLLFHLVGLLVIVLVFLIKKNRFPRWNQLSALVFMPGILSVLTILLNNLSITKIGVTLTVGVGLFAQLLTSAVIAHFGLFGMPISSIKKEKILGFTMISMGVVFMVIM